MRAASRFVCDLTVFGATCLLFFFGDPSATGRNTLNRVEKPSRIIAAQSSAQSGFEGVICVVDDKQSLLVIHTPSAVAAVAEGGSGRKRTEDCEARGEEQRSAGQDREREHQPKSNSSSSVESSQLKAHTSSQGILSSSSSKHSQVKSSSQTHTTRQEERYPPTTTTTVVP